MLARSAPPGAGPTTHTYIYAPTIWISTTAGGPGMDPTYLLLTKASLQLFADGHNHLAADVQQLARKWIPPDYIEEIDDDTPDLEGYDYG